MQAIGRASEPEPSSPEGALDSGQLLEKLPAAAYTCDASGLITYFNERAVQLWGREPKLRSAVDRFCGSFRLFSPEGKPIRHEECWMALALRENCSYDGHEIVIERPDGSRRHASAHANPLHDEQGRLVGAVNVLVDITERKRSEEKAKFLTEAAAAIAELNDYASTLQKIASLAVPDFADWCTVDMVNADGLLERLAVTHVDPAKVRHIHELQKRYPPDPQAPHGPAKVLRTGEAEMSESIPDELLAAAARDEEHLRILRALGLRSFISVPLTWRGKPLGVLTFVTAESGRHYDAADLLAAEDLAQRAVIAIENARLYGALKEADRRKDEFLATLAHELRNPLAAIGNALQVLNLKGPDVPELRSGRDVIERQVGQLTRLIDDLLDISRITCDKLELDRRRVDLADVVQGAVESSRPAIEQAGHRLTVELPPEAIHLYGDPVRLPQVFINLLNNAAKYTEPGGHIRLTAEKADREVLVRVNDTGVGIAADKLPLLFERFFQVDRSLERKQGGLGIGLTLVRRLVEMHGGTVEAHSAGVGQGSEFIVRLPTRAAKKARRPRRQAGNGSPEAVSARRILVVDDNRDSADSLSLLLKLAGNEIHTAYDGLEAVEAAARFQPDTVLLDIGMPKLNGYDACRRIREQPWGKNVKLIALTGWGQEEDRRRTQEAGFDSHLVKPVDLGALQKLLSAATSPA